jgi:hypothetical protein
LRDHRLGEGWEPFVERVVVSRGDGVGIDSRLAMQAAFRTRSPGNIERHDGAVGSVRLFGVASSTLSS